MDRGRGRKGGRGEGKGGRREEGRKGVAQRMRIELLFCVDSVTLIKASVYSMLAILQTLFYVLDMH